MGIFAVVLVVLIVLLILYCILNTFAARVKKFCRGFIEKLKAMLFYDSFIRYLIEGNLQLCLDNIFFVYLYVSFETEEEASQSYSRIGFFVVVIFW